MKIVAAGLLGLLLALMAVLSEAPSPSGEGRITGSQRGGGCSAEAKRASTQGRSPLRPAISDASASPFFVGDEYSPDRYEFQSSGPGNSVRNIADPEDDDRTVIELRTNEQTGGDGSVVRAQLVVPIALPAGHEYWQVARVYVDPDLPARGKWTTVMSSFGPPFDGSSPTGLRIINDELVWETNARGVPYCLPWRVPLVKGRWFAVARHERLSADPREGFFEIAYSPDVERVPMTHQTLDNGRTRWYLQTIGDGQQGIAPRILNYHMDDQPGWSGDYSILFAKHRLWPSQTSLDQLNAEYTDADDA